VSVREETESDEWGEWIVQYRGDVRQGRILKKPSDKYLAEKIPPISEYTYELYREATVAGETVRYDREVVKFTKKLSTEEMLELGAKTGKKVTEVS